MSEESERDCPDCGTTLKTTDLKTAKMSHICPNCAPEFVKASAFDDYDGRYSDPFA